jgi:hypothetical protein
VCHVLSRGCGALLHLPYRFALQLVPAYGGAFCPNYLARQRLRLPGALEVPDQLREFVVLGIEVGHRKVEDLRQPLQGLQIGLPTYLSSAHGEVMLIDVRESRAACSQVQPDKAHGCAVHDEHCVGQLRIAAAEVAAPVGPAEGAIHVDMLVHGCHVPAAWPLRISAAGSVSCRRLRRLG